MRKLLLAIVLMAAHGCATGNHPIAHPVANRSTTSLSEAQAREIGKLYAEGQGWAVKHMWEGMAYVPRLGEWEMLFDVVGTGCPYTVYVNDQTGAARAVTIGLP